MEINSTTFFIIFVLLLVLYLLDNIKSLEDSILSNPNVEKSDNNITKRYFRDIKYKKPPITTKPPPPPKKEVKKYKIKDKVIIDNYKHPKEISIKIPKMNIDRINSNSSSHINRQLKLDRPIKVTFNRRY